MPNLTNVRLKQARESLDDVQALIAEDMGSGLILTSLYYTYYYSILALMDRGQVPTTMQSVTIGIFEQRYMITGVFKKEYGEAVHRICGIKPNCSGEGTVVSSGEVNELTVLANAFLQDVEIYLDRKHAD
jgi:uncharacterized protein (UPF0332 family)